MKIFCTSVGITIIFGILYLLALLLSGSDFEKRTDKIAKWLSVVAILEVLGLIICMILSYNIN